MARPIKDGLDYFAHDCDASSDEKIDALRALYGNDGYAFYFICLERIYRSKDLELIVSDAETKQILARKVAVTPELLEKMINTAIKYACFDRISYEKRGVLTSEGVKKRAGVVLEKRQKMRNTYQNRVSDAETTQETTQETIAETPQSKVKKRKEKISLDDPAKLEVEAIYQLYPTRDANNSNRSTGKCSKDKSKIAKLLKEGYPLKAVMQRYVDDAAKTGSYLKNLGTFLSQLPDVDEANAVEAKPYDPWENCR